MIRLVTAKRLDEMTAERERLRADLAASPWRATPVTVRADRPREEAV